MGQIIGIKKKFVITKIVLSLWYNNKGNNKMTQTKLQIETIAKTKGMTVTTVIPNQFGEVEYLAARLKFGVTAFFLLSNYTFDYTYSHTYNAITDKTTKRKPKGF